VLEYKRADIISYYKNGRSTTQQGLSGLLQKIDKMLIVTSNSHKASDKAIKPKLTGFMISKETHSKTMLIGIENQYPPSTKRYEFL
jgi:hypothetical protein